MNILKIVETDLEKVKKLKEKNVSADNILVASKSSEKENSKLVKLYSLLCVLLHINFPNDFSEHHTLLLKIYLKLGKINFKIKLLLK